MEISHQKCSNHENKNGVIYCNICGKYMCEDCEKLHMQLLSNHNPINLDKNINEILYLTCKEKNHFNQQLIFYCNEHKKLCCIYCKDNMTGIHSKCNISYLDDIKRKKEEEYQNIIMNLKSNVQKYDDIIQNISKKSNTKKEEIQISIQKLFTQIKNEINNREDALLSEIENKFKQFYEEPIKNDNNIIKEINSNINKKFNPNILDINFFINEIEKLNEKNNNIKNFIKEYEEGKKYNTIIEFKIVPEDITDLLDKIKNIGNIYINENNGLKIYECFNTLKKQNNVLLISEQQNSLLNNLLKLNERIDKISIFNPNFIIPMLLYENINKYKIIIYDLKNGGYTSTNNYEDIKKYLENGGNIIITHDHWSYTNIPGNCTQLLNAKLVLQQYSYINKARILNNMHPIFKSHFNLDLSNNSLIDIAYTHKTDTFFNNKEEYMKNLLIKLEDNKDGEYLLVREIGKGKLIFWNVGHSDNLTNIEQKLFINIIHWICS